MKQRKDSRHNLADGTKQCSACEQWLPLSNFWVSNRQGVGGLFTTWDSYCKDCARDKRRAHLHRTAYNLTQEAYAALVDAQGGVCAICGHKPTGTRHDTVLHVDHDHTTDDVRGLLCTGCNTGLGALGESVERLQAAIAYLKLHQ